MDCYIALESMLPAYRQYYDVQTDHVEEPFDACAQFHSHDKQFFLSKSATISESESNEYLYFVAREALTENELTELCEKAWNEGLKNVIPHKDHQSSDIILIILSDSTSENMAKAVKKIKYYKSYRHTFHGWSHFRLAVIEPSSGKIYVNRQGRSLKPTLTNILKHMRKGD